MLSWTRESSSLEEQMRASRGSRGATMALAPIALLIVLGWLGACSPPSAPASSPGGASPARSDGAAASTAPPNGAASDLVRALSEAIRVIKTDRASTMARLSVDPRGRRAGARGNLRAVRPRVHPAHSDPVRRVWPPCSSSLRLPIRASPPCPLTTRRWSTVWRRRVLRTALRRTIGSGPRARNSSSRTAGRTLR